MAKPAVSKPPQPLVHESKEQPFTQENFEKELKELAAKAKEETWEKWAGQQIWILIQAATLLSLAATYSNVSQLALSPVYGAIPTSVWHSKGVMTACFLGWSFNLIIKRRLPVKKPATLLPVIAIYIPMIQGVLCLSSEQLGANYGPIITEGLTFMPLLLLSVSCTASILDDLELSNGRFAWLSDALPGIGSFVFFKSMELFSESNIQRVIGKSLFGTRIGLQIALSSLYALFLPSKLLLFAVPAALHTGFLNVHIPTPFMTNVLKTTLGNNGWALLDRQESVTGYISVVQSVEMGFRVMRCDHSLLGGEWPSSSTKTTVAEPIYGVFIMLEAVRLIEIPETVPDNEAKALVVGLGVGTTPSALISHGIDTTIVEIDPVVRDFALKYFDLPKKHNAVISDAVSYASDLAKTDEKYDYIIHDVFTGGAEPINLFTVEFITNLKSILTPKGVIAINYAGDISLPSARVVVNTILSIFPTCRIFRETPEETTQKKGARRMEFINMIIYCTNLDDPITFRDPVEADFLESGARKAFLMPKHEIDAGVFDELESDGGLLYANDTERFSAWQQSSAVGHWQLMRTVLPPAIWENW